MEGSPQFGPQVSAPGRLGLRQSIASLLLDRATPYLPTFGGNAWRSGISHCTRGADATGASGTGVLAAILFDAIAPGPVTMTLSGSATGPGGAAMGLRFTPVTVTVQ